MSIKYKFNKQSMDIIMTATRKLGCHPSEAVDKLLSNPQLLIEVTDDIRNYTDKGRNPVNT